MWRWGVGSCSYSDTRKMSTTTCTTIPVTEWSNMVGKVRHAVKPNWLKDEDWRLQSQIAMFSDFPFPASFS